MKEWITVSIAMIILLPSAIAYATPSAPPAMAINNPVANNIGGERIWEATSGQQIQILVSVFNTFPDTRPVTALVEVRNSNDQTVYLTWQTTIMSSKEEYHFGVSWTADTPDNYRLRTFVVSPLSEDIVTVLSPIAETRIAVFDPLDSFEDTKIEFLTVYNHTQIPDLYMRMENTGKVYPGEEGSYCWDICADAVAIEPSHTNVVDKGSEIEFRIHSYRQPADLSAYIQSLEPFEPTCEETYDNATLGSSITCDEPPEIPQLTKLDSGFRYKVDLPSDTYRLWVFVVWQYDSTDMAGDASYYYKLQVQ